MRHFYRVCWLLWEDQSDRELTLLDQSEAKLRSCVDQSEAELRGQSAGEGNRTGHVTLTQSPRPLYPHEGFMRSMGVIHKCKCETKPKRCIRLCHELFCVFLIITLTSRESSVSRIFYHKSLIVSALFLSRASCHV